MPEAQTNAVEPDAAPHAAERSSERRRAFPAAPAAESAPAPAADVMPPPPAVGASGAPAAAAPAAKPDRSRAEAAAGVAAPSRALQGAVRQEPGAADAAAPAAPEWLERIIRLRTEGRHAEADAELKRFRERYPDVPVPPAALPPAGTR
jgi:hypothetical protein